MSDYDPRSSEIIRLLFADAVTRDDALEGMTVLARVLLCAAGGTGLSAEEFDVFCRRLSVLYAEQLPDMQSIRRTVQ